MRYRKEWLAWTATAVGTLGVMGLASAQSGSLIGSYEALAESASMDHGRVSEVQVAHEEPAERSKPIADDGWSMELPTPRQFVVARRNGQQAPVHIDVFNERGEVVEHVEWTGDTGNVKPVALDALLAGRYAVRVTSGERSEVVRFRKD